MNEQRSGLGQRVPARSSRVVTNEYDLEEEEEYYVTRPHTSARRYDLIPEQVIRQGNRQYTIHHGAPPVPRRRQYFEEDEEQPKSRRHVHPLVWFGLCLFVMVIGWIAISALGNVWQSKQDDWTYGQTRTYQADAVVGHNNDSSNSPSHFIAINLRGQILVIELPAGDASKARSYHITTVQNNDGNPPVKLSFQDLNADGRLDMIITIGDPGSSFTVMLFNDGTQFVSKLGQ